MEMMSSMVNSVKVRDLNTILRCRNPRIRISPNKIRVLGQH
jgi:hypothetical protein